MKFLSVLGCGPSRHLRTRKQNTIYIVLCIVLSAIVIAIAVSGSFGLVVRDIGTGTEGIEAGVNLDIELLSIDPLTGTLNVDLDLFFWNPDDPVELPTNCQNLHLNRTFDVFMDENLIANPPDKEEEETPSSGRPKKATFQVLHDPCDWSPKQNIGTMRKGLKLFQEAPDLRNMIRRKDYGHIGSGLQAYPFDSYYSVLYLYAEERITGSANATKDTFINIDSVRGVASNFHTYYPGPVFNTAEEGLGILFTVDRSVAIKVFCLIIVITNWVVSLVFLWITVACLFWKERVVKELFAIPITVLFAFSAVRGNMPGAPAGFGAFIDYVGILPNFAVLTVCSFILILIILVERIRVGSPEPEQGPGAKLESAAPPWPMAMPQPSPLEYAK